MLVDQFQNIDVPIFIDGKEKKNTLCKIVLYSISTFYFILFRLCKGKIFCIHFVIEICYLYNV